MTRLLVLSSAQAGGTEEAALAGARVVLAGSADLEVVPTGSPADLQAALDRRGGRLPVVAGGDGSLHLVVAALRERGELATTAVGLLPMGTGNDFARSVGVPLEPAAAAAAVLCGAARPLDVLVDDAGSVAVNAAHVGVGARASAAAAGLKPRLGPVGYRLGSVVAGATARAPRLTVTVDGRALATDRRVLQVGIGNGATIGGGSPLFPGAQPDDGRLDVVVSLATAPLARLSYGAALRHGSHVQRFDVRVASGLTVTVEGDPAELNVDGELAGRVTRRSWRVEPAAWRLLVP